MANIFLIIYSHSVATCFEINTNLCTFCNGKFDCAAHELLSHLKMRWNLMKTLKWLTFQKQFFKHTRNRFNMSLAMDIYSTYVFYRFVMLFLFSDIFSTFQLIYWWMLLVFRLVRSIGSTTSTPTKTRCRRSYIWQKFYRSYVENILAQELGRMAKTRNHTNGKSCYSPGCQSVTLRCWGKYEFQFRLSIMYAMVKLLKKFNWTEFKRSKNVVDFNCWCEISDNTKCRTHEMASKTGRSLFSFICERIVRVK